MVLRQRGRQMIGWILLAIACTFGSGGQTMKPTQSLSVEDIARTRAASNWGVDEQYVKAWESSQQLPDGMAMVLVRLQHSAAEENPALADQPLSLNGLVHGDRFITGWADSTALILEAWKYGPDRTVPAVKLATILDRFHTRSVGDPVVVDTANLQAYPLIHPPMESEVDGLPAIVYWANTSADLGDEQEPFSRLTVIVEADYRPVLRVDSYDEVKQSSQP
jgi:hypothetical protein